ncbi:MAG: hypothetical protein ABIL62_04905, partial [Planctomycetota bacterium]
RSLFVGVEAGIGLEARRWMLEEKRPSNAGFQLKPAVGGSSFYDKHRYSAGCLTAEHRQP